MGINKIHFIRALTAFAFAIAGGFFLLRQTAIPEYAARYEASQLALTQRLGDIGQAAFGTAFFNNAPGSIVDGFMSFGEKIYPHREVPGTRSPGLLYPVRRFFAGIAYVLIFPFIIFNLLYLAFARGGAITVRDLATLGIRLILVVSALVFYTAWDRALYQSLTVPLVREFETGNMAQSMVRIALNNPNATTAGPTTGQATYSRNGLDCTVTRAQNAAAYEAECLAGAPDDLRKAQEGLDVTVITPEGIAQLNEGRREGGLVEKVVAKITEGLVGLVLLAQQLSMLVIIWFAWLAMIVGRAISVALAPVMFIWSLLPDQWNKFVGWFRGHAKIVLQPIGFTLGLLIIWIIQLGILTTDLLGDGVVGIGARVGMFVFFFLLTLKLKSIIDQAGADVTKIAASIGGSVSSMAVTAATTLGSTAAIAATGGAAAAGGLATGLGGAALRQLGQTRIGSAIGRVVSAGKERWTGLSAPQARGFDQSGRGFVRRAASGAKRTASLGVGAVKNSAELLINAYRNSITKLDVPHLKQLGSAMRTEAKEEAVSKFAVGQQIVTRLFNTQAAPSGRVLYDPDAVERAAATTRVLDHLGNLPVPRAGEKINNIDLPVKIRIVAGALEHDQIRKWSSMLDDVDVLLGSEEVDGKVRPVMTKVTHDALLDKWNNDAQFKAQMKNHFGELPMKEDEFGNKQPDFAALMEKSTVFTNMLLAGSEKTAARYAELQRRDSISQAAEVPPGSVTDLVLRSLPVELTAKRPNESDVEYGVRLRTLAQELTAFAHAKVVDKSDQSLIEIRSNPAVLKERIERIESIGWANPEAFAQANKDDKNKITQTVQVAVAEAKSMMQKAQEATITHKGTTYGLDLDTFYRSGGREQRWIAHDNSLYTRVAQDMPDTASQQEVFEKAKELALKEMSITAEDINKLKPQKQREMNRELYRKMFGPPTEN